MNPPITPGEILLEEYLIPMGISQNAMARAIGVAPRAINEIIHARRSITPAILPYFCIRAFRIPGMFGLRGSR
jgi:addiction module HigA family antidote